MAPPTTSAPPRPNPAGARPSEAHTEHKGLVLAVIAVAQLMVVLDATIVNIALPSAQKALGFANADRQWIVTAYALSFGSLLLLGGRVGDLIGRRTTFIVGLGGFALASAVGGASTSFGMLVAARAAQGVFGAVLAPSALGMLTTTFTDPRERGRAFGIFSAVAGGGSAVGLVLGGLLTEGLSWRWCLYVNLIFALGAGIGAMLVLSNPPRTARPRLDVPGTAIASGGLFCIVLGFSEAETSGWGKPVTLLLLAGGVAALIGFLVLESRVAHPLMPLRVVADRARGGAYLAVVMSATAIFGVFLFLAFYLQTIRGYSPIVNGLAFLPLTAGILVSSTTGNVIVYPKVGAKIMVAIGMAGGAIGMLGLSRLGLHSSYAAGVLPWLVLLGLSFGWIFSPAINQATAGVRPDEAGVASALVNTGQQVGGSIGVALLSTLAADAAGSFARSHHDGRLTPVLAAVHGYTTSFEVSAAIFLVGAAICGALLPAGRPAHLAAAPAPAHAV